MAKNSNVIKVSFLGGVGEIGKNMTILEYNNEMLIVDCGIEFTHDEFPGIEAVLPDISYVLDNISKVKGIVLTHGHEDHMGAIPYFDEVFKKIPVYGTSLTLGLVRRKYDSYPKIKKFNVVSSGDTVKLGEFSVEFIHVTHSMGGACALSIKTDAGTVFFTGDFKLDDSPIDNKKTDVKRIKEIGNEGVLLMLGESTNIERPGKSTSERTVGKTLDKLFNEYKRERIVVACFASSNYRIQQVINIAQKYNRKVYLAGRSMKGVVDVAQEVGELKVPKGIIVENINNVPMDKAVILATGSQGEPLSALKKMSQGEFGKVNIGEKDVVILSSSPIPGNEKCVYDVINDLYRRGAKVIYDAMNDIHSSGHAYYDELKDMLLMIKPQCFMPVHGEYRHQWKHAELAKQVGINPKNILIPNVGQSFGVSDKGIKEYAGCKSGIKLVDKEVIEDGQRVVKERNILANHGVLIAMAAVSTETGKLTSDVDILSYGFNLTNEVEMMVKESIMEETYHLDLDDDININELAANCKKNIKRKLNKLEHFPIIVPIIVSE